MDSFDIKEPNHPNEKVISFAGFYFNCSPEIIIRHPYSYKSESDIWSLWAFLFYLSILKYPFNNQELTNMRSIKKIDKLKLIGKNPKCYNNNLKNW